MNTVIRNFNNYFKFIKPKYFFCFVFHGISNRISRLKKSLGTAVFFFTHYSYDCYFFSTSSNATIIVEHRSSNFFVAINNKSFLNIRSVLLLVFHLRTTSKEKIKIDDFIVSPSVSEHVCPP